MVIEPPRASYSACWTAPTDRPGSLREGSIQLALPDRPSIRIQRLEESVTIIKQFFSQDTVTFTGEHYTVTDLPTVPKPVQHPHPPILHRRSRLEDAHSRRHARPTLLGSSYRVKDGADTFEYFEDSEAAPRGKDRLLARGRRRALRRHRVESWDQKIHHHRESAGSGRAASA